MDLKIGSALKALAVLVGMFLGADVISDTKIDQVVGALSIIGAVAWDLWETWKLHRQGVTSTESEDNDAKKMSAVKLSDAKEEAAKP